MFAACLMLEHVGDAARARRIHEAVVATLREGTDTTRDLGGSASTGQFADAVIARISA